MERYQIIQKVGSGNSAAVFKARDTATGAYVAVKQMNPDTPLEEATMKQVEITSRLDHPNIIKIVDIVIGEEQQLNIILQYVDENLLELYSSSKYGINENQIRCLIYQVALALDHMHCKGYMHRDLKPQNILIDRKQALVKLVDFGSAKQVSLAGTDYVCTRWYRAPESLLGLKKCTPAIDIFALGCIALELFTLKPIFPGENTMDQLNKIFNVLGSPTAETWPLGYTQTRKKSVSFPQKMKIPLVNFIPTASKQFIKLVQQMLVLDPAQRITAKQILTHPFFLDIKSLLPEPVYKASLRQVPPVVQPHGSSVSNYHSRPQAHNRNSSKSPGARSRSKTPEASHIKNMNLTQVVVSKPSKHETMAETRSNNRLVLDTSNYLDENRSYSKTPPKRLASQLNYKTIDKNKLLWSPLENRGPIQSNYAQRYRSRNELTVNTSHSRGRSSTMRYIK